MTRSMFLSRMALCAAVFVGSVNASAAVVFADNFDADDFASVWTVTAGGVDVGAYADLCNNQGASGTSYCVDTEGTGPGTNAAFELATPIPSLVAGDYTFAFDWGNNSGSGSLGDNILDWTITATEGVLGSGSVNSGSAADWIYANESAAFSVASPVTNVVISFAQVGAQGDWGGTILDNVQLELTNQYPVPGPATLGLLGIGLAGLGLWRTRAR